MKIKEILVGPLFITTDHIPGNTINKVFVCETDRTRYFRTYAMSESEDVFYETDAKEVTLSAYTNRLYIDRWRNKVYYFNKF